MTVKIKICGLKNKEDVLEANECGADFFGFVFFSASPRNVSAQEAKELSKNINENSKSVAVLVDPSDEEINNILNIFVPDFIQLHGDESACRVEEIKKKYNVAIIKAVKIRSGDDLAFAMNYQDVADYLLFDAKPPKDSVFPGGLGRKFDWSLLENRHFNLPWFLSGGINIDNVKEAINLTNAKYIDVSSGVEKSPGIKDKALIKDFIERVKSL